MKKGSILCFLLSAKAIKERNNNRSKENSLLCFSLSLYLEKKDSSKSAMKVMKKGKVHPSPPLPSSSSSNGDDSLSVFKLLQSAILVLVSVLSAEDLEVLAYLITRSLNTTNVVSCKKKRSHKAPLLDCQCFDCYTSYWSKWDSSSNRELINQIIEAFEDHLTRDEISASHTSKKNKKRAKKIEISEEQPQNKSIWLLVS